MIFLNKQDVYSLKKPLDICMKFAQEVQEKNMEPGRYELCDGIYCGVSVSELKARDEFFFEAHRKYADVHYIIEGTQRMWVGLTDQMEVVSYTEEKDFVKVLGEHHVDILQIPGTATVVFPNDAHTLDPNYLPKEPVKKIIFKVPLELFETVEVKGAIE